MSDTQRDHLFISYAWEDGAFAEWLALKLTAEGYKVWCDRLKLLGGESYPQDIDKAIREQTFRLIAVLSKHSINKANPLKERTLALSLARERGEDFLIPLNLDGIAPTEIGWMLSDLTYISFCLSWAEGFTQLLKKLQSIGAPRPLVDGKKTISQWFATRNNVSSTPENLWTNLIEIKELPQTLLRFTIINPAPIEVLAAWPHYQESGNSIWALEPPQEYTASLYPVEAVEWAAPYAGSRSKFTNIITYLLKRYLRMHCLRRGLIETGDGQYVYFPFGLLPDNRISYTGYNGRKAWVQVVGERTFKTGPKSREQCRYHLSPVFLPTLQRYSRPVVQVRMRLYLTDQQGRPLEARRALRRRKKIAKDWWNHQWLSRVLAVTNWLADGADCFNLALTSHCRIIVAGEPICLEAPVGIDDGSVVPYGTSEETELTGEEPEDDLSENDEDLE